MANEFTTPKRKECSCTDWLPLDPEDCPICNPRSQEYFEVGEDTTFCRDCAYERGGLVAVGHPIVNNSGQTYICDGCMREIPSEDDNE